MTAPPRGLNAPVLERQPDLTWDQVSGMMERAVVWNRQESEGTTLRMMRRSTEHDFEPEAKSVLTPRQRAIQEIRSIVVEKLEGVRSHVYLIGSCARGETSRHSDIDIAIETLDPAPSSLISDIRIMLDQSDIPFFVDVFDVALLEGQFRDEIRKEGVPWTAPKES